MQLFEVQDRPQSMVSVVVNSIKQLLIDGKLKPGDLLPSEADLCEQLKISRSSVREAMKILNAYGVVDIRRGEGTYISSGVNQNMFMPLLFQILVKDRDMTELVEVREMLELGIIDLVIQHATDEELAKIKKAELAFEMEMLSLPSDDYAKARKLDIEFHRNIAAYCHNPIIENMYAFVIELFRSSINPGNPGVLEAHKGIMRGIATRDRAVARKHQRDHIASWISSHKELLRLDIDVKKD